MTKRAIKKKQKKTYKQKAPPHHCEIFEQQRKKINPKTFQSGVRVTHEGTGIRNKQASTGTLETRRQQISAFTVIRENYFLSRDLASIEGEGTFTYVSKKLSPT